MIMRKTHAAFTLLELLVVIGLIGIIVAMSSFGYVNYSQKSRDARRRIDLQQLRSALELYRSNTSEGVYPTLNEYGSGATSVLVTAGLINTIPLDPAGNAYVYTPSPAGCNNTTSFCISYTLSTTLEVNNQAYTVNPNSIN